MTLVYAKKKKKFPYSYTLPCIYPLVNLIRFAYAKKKKKKMQPQNKGPGM